MYSVKRGTDRGKTNRVLHQIWPVSNRLPLRLSEKVALCRYAMGGSEQEYGPALQTNGSTRGKRDRPTTKPPPGKTWKCLTQPRKMAASTHHRRWNTALARPQDFIETGVYPENEVKDSMGGESFRDGTFSQDIDNCHTF